MTFTQAPIGWDKDIHGLNIPIPEPGTRGSEVVETINEAVLDNTWRKLPKNVRDAIKLGAQIGWESASTMPDGSPNPVQIQDLEPLLNLSPKVLGYKLIRAGISRGLGFDARLVDQAALSIGGASLLRKGIQTVGPQINKAKVTVGLKPKVLKTKPTSNVIDMSNMLDDWLNNPKYNNFNRLPSESSISVVKPGSLFSKDYKGIFSKPQPYAYHMSTKQGTIEEGDTQGGHLGYFSSKFPDTTKRDLDLYGANIREFTKFNTFEDALAAGEVSNQALLETGKKRWPGIDAQIGDNYFKIYKGPNNQIKVLPYNKWYQLKRNPFKVPDDVQANLKRFESRQLELLTPNSNEIVKYDKGTVNSFVRYVNREILFQKEQQRLIEGMAEAIYKDAGVPYKRGKTWLSVDLSHAVPRSKGGPGYTFLEAWRENQTRGATDILNDQTLIDLGIPRNWNEYFLRWHQEQGKGNPATDLGRLADISWDDYNAAQQGVDINLIKLRRKTINHLIQRQISDPTTFKQPGQRGATIGDDFEIMVRESKGLGLDDDIIGSSPELTWSAKEFDLEWRAQNYNKKQSLRNLTEWEQNQPKIRKSTKSKPKPSKYKQIDTEGYVEWTYAEYEEFMNELYGID